MEMLLPILIGVAILGFFIQRLKSGPGLRKTSGTVVSSEVSRAAGSTEAYIPVVTFTFRVDGRDYTVSTGMAHPGAGGVPAGFNPWAVPRSHESAMAALSSLQPGAPCQVLYSSEDPMRAVITASDAGRNARILVLVAAAIVGILAAGIMFFVESGGK